MNCKQITWFVFAMFVVSSCQAHSRRCNNTSTECKKVDPDVARNVTQLIQNRGFPVENYHVTTEDGFILSVQRIPHGRRGKATGVGARPVVFLQHGLLADSSCWVFDWEDDSLGYILADAGFDVWLGNIRGNRYSRQHVKYKTTDREFWDWSWEEMADYDIPAMINFVLKVTQQAQLSYIGHSQGTLVGFLSFSEHPEVASKVNLFIALAPIYHLNHTDSIVTDAAYVLGPVQELFFPVAATQFLPGFLLKELVSRGLCGGKYTEKACYDVGELLFGFDDKNNNMSRVPVFAAHWPCGTSFKTIIHFGQVIYFGQTRRFDYGKLGNLIHYGQENPPGYDVSTMTTPTAFFVGQHDVLSVEADVNPVEAAIPHSVHYEIIPDWNHADFILGMDAPEKLYNKIIKMVRNAQ